MLLQAQGASDTDYTKASPTVRIRKFSAISAELSDFPLLEIRD